MLILLKVQRGIELRLTSKVINASGTKSQCLFVKYFFILLLGVETLINELSFFSVNTDVILTHDPQRRITSEA